MSAVSREKIAEFKQFFFQLGANPPDYFNIGTPQHCFLPFLKSYNHSLWQIIDRARDYDRDFCDFVRDAFNVNLQHQHDTEDLHYYVQNAIRGLDEYAEKIYGGAIMVEST
jgi:hypothetical protein